MQFNDGVVLLADKITRGGIAPSATSAATMTRVDLVLDTTGKAITIGSLCRL